jgi:hypothetical protein
VLIDCMDLLQTALTTLAVLTALANIPYLRIYNIGQHAICDTAYCPQCFLNSQVPNA